MQSIFFKNIWKNKQKKLRNIINCYAKSVLLKIFNLQKTNFRYMKYINLLCLKLVRWRQHMLNTKFNEFIFRALLSE